MTDNAEDGVSAITAIITALKPLDETTRLNVLEFVMKQLGIKLSGHNEPRIAVWDSGFAPQITREEEEEEEEENDIKDIRSLANQKKPKTVNDKVAVLAYYLKTQAPKDERRDYITAEDIETYFPSADFELPVARMALINAKNAGYLHAMGSGKYKLNPVGHNLVTHKLPGGEGSPPKRTKRRTKKKRR
jgi:hypothetical protein